jgi:hypothetical protein
VILISDAFDDVTKLRNSLRHIRHAGHEILMFHILAPEEIDFPFTKPTKFRDFENPSRIVEANQIRDDYRKNFDAWRTGLQKAMTDANADLITLTTDRPVDRILGQYLARRGARG